MTEQIIIDINPASDGVRCGECKLRGSDFTKRIFGCANCWFVKDNTYYRDSSCLATARTLREEREAARRVIEAARRVIEAGNGIARCLPKKPVVVTGPATDLATAMSKVIFDKVDAWDAAVAQYEAARSKA